MASTAAHHPKADELSADAAAAAVRAVRATFRRVLGTRPTVVSLLGAGSDDF